VVLRFNKKTLFNKLLLSFLRSHFTQKSPR